MNSHVGNTFSMSWSYHELILFSYFDLRSILIINDLDCQAVGLVWMSEVANKIMLLPKTNKI